MTKRSTKKKPAKKQERQSKYWICDSCALAKGWTFPTGAITVMSGLCGHCDSPITQTLIPTCDFSGPGKKAIWD